MSPRAKTRTSGRGGKKAIRPDDEMTLLDLEENPILGEPLEDTPL